MSYRDDRQFTDEKHSNIITNQIYPELGWVEVEGLGDELRELRDCTESIDYEIIDTHGMHIMTQERIRRFKYDDFSDFTIRFERPKNENETERLSEYYKMKTYCNRHRQIPFYFLYVTTADDMSYRKYVLVNLQALFAHVRSDEVRIDRNSTVSYIDNNVLYAGVNINPDDSSTLVVFDVVYLENLFDDVIMVNKGFSHICSECGLEKKLLISSKGKKYLACPNWRTHPRR